MKPPVRETIRARASEVAFGSTIIQNNLRALVVEAIVDYALKPSWRWCSQDWSGWDFEHESGVRLEVKQSAARQTWTAPKSRQLPRFDIRERTGYWENGTTWIAQRGRYAKIYIFAHHPVADESADHRDPLQWHFHVVGASNLPPARSIGLSAVQALSQAYDWNGLLEAVEGARLLLHTSNAATENPQPRSG